MKRRWPPRLGDDLQAPLDESSPHHWRDLGDFTGAAQLLPQGVKPLSEFVKAPARLDPPPFHDRPGVSRPRPGAAETIKARPAAGDGARRSLALGWICRHPPTRPRPPPCVCRNAIASRSSNRKPPTPRMSAPGSSPPGPPPRKRWQSRARGGARGRGCRARSTEQSLIAAQDESTRAARAAAERISALANLEAEIRRLEQSVAAAEEARNTALAAIKALGDGADLAKQAGDARSAAAHARGVSGEARAALETLKREGDIRRHRLTAIAEDAARWEARRAAAASQIAELSRRHDELHGELAAAERVPQEMAGSAQRPSRRHRRGRSGAAISQPMRRVAAESVLAEADKNAKAADQALSAVREERARAQALSRKRRRPDRGTARPHPRRAGMHARGTARSAPKSRTAKSCRRWNRPRRRSRD